MREKSTFQIMRDSEREKRKALIIAAAMKLFTEKPFHEIGIRDIALEAAISPGSIYRYFPGRDDLYIEALIRDVKRIEQKVRARAGERNSLESLTIDVVDFMIDNDMMLQMICYFFMRGEENKKTLRKFNSVMQYFAKIFDEIVSGTKGAQGIRFHSQAFFASLAGIVMTFCHDPGKPKHERREYMHKLALMIMREGLRYHAIETPKTAMTHPFKRHAVLKKTV